MLVHFSNHDAGRDLMKDCIWKVSPEGGFIARKSDNPKQLVLIKPTPELGTLKDWIVKKLSDRPYRWAELSHLLKSEIWLDKHLKEIIAGLKKENILLASDYSGRFSQKANPLLTLNNAQA